MDIKRSEPHEKPVWPNLNENPALVPTEPGTSSMYRFYDHHLNLPTWEASSCSPITVYTSLSFRIVVSQTGYKWLAKWLQLLFPPGNHSLLITVSLASYFQALIVK